MFHLLKWSSVLLFLSMPVLIVSTIWFGDFRFLWISLVNGIFSMVAGSYADTVAIAKRIDDQSTLF